MFFKNSDAIFFPLNDCLGKHFSGKSNVAKVSSVNIRFMVRVEKDVVVV